MVRFFTIDYALSNDQRKISSFFRFFLFLPFLNKLFASLAALSLFRKILDGGGLLFALSMVLYVWESG